MAKLPQLTIIAHFFNEEYLLPWWLSHHVALADDGILIDYGSTDRSVDICRRLAPGWRIVRSRNDFFDARAADLEVMDIECSIGGWKLALNVTEFLCVDSEEALCKLLEGQGERGYGLRGVCMVDPPGVYATDPSYDRPLLAQRDVRLLRRGGEIADRGAQSSEPIAPAAQLSAWRLRRGPA
jgi:hypothetical protein